MHTLTSPSDIERLFKHGRRSSHRLLVVLAAPLPEGRGLEGRVMFVAGRKMGGAVFRNRCKRVMREAARRAGAPWRGWDVALMARPGIATASPDEIDAAFSRLLPPKDATGPRSERKGS